MVEIRWVAFSMGYFRSSFEDRIPRGNALWQLSKMSAPSVIKTAEFEARTTTYWLWSGTLLCLVTIVLIPIAPIWLLVGTYFTRRYLNRMECVLTEKALHVKKGMLIRVEKSIPLEKITDMGMIQGPIMRKMGLWKLTVETAGTSGPGALVALTGIVDAPAFRQLVLEQRDGLDGSSSGKPDEEGEVCSLLREIRDSLKRIESFQGPAGR
jgi:putative membrane protein